MERKENKVNNTFKSFAAGAFFTLIIMLMVLTGASCTENQPSQAAGETGDCEDMVLVRVGEAGITLGDLFENPSFYMLVSDQLIQRELFEQEVLRRGITIDMDEIQQKVDDVIEQNGGWENFKSTIPPSIPISLVPADLRRNILQQSYPMAIIEDRYEKEHGPVTDDELETQWLAVPGLYEDRLAAEMGITPEEVTFEMAHEAIKEDIRTQWQNEHLPTLVEYLKENTEVEFYILDALNESADLQIPEIDGDDSFEYVPLEEHDDVLSDEGHEDHGEESEVGETGETEEAEVPGEPEEDEGN